MARCGTCNTIILFGAMKDGDRSFCNPGCHEAMLLERASKAIPEEVIRGRLEEIHRSDCPVCAGPGPVDLHESHHVWSLIVFTSSQRKVQLSCQSCGTRARLMATVSSGLFGWWGMPWGLIMTPVQIVRNLAGLAGGPDPEIPSEALERAVRLDVASSLFVPAPPSSSQAEPETGGVF